MWRRERHTELYAENLQIHPEVHGIIILIWILQKYGLKVWSGHNWLRIGYKVDSNEPSTHNKVADIWTEKQSVSYNKESAS
jgi:hypothetical protein